MPNVLLTGFDSFDGHALNPSWEAVRRLHGKRIAGHRVVARRLPVEFGASLRELRAAIADTSPALVLCVGLAATRTAISLERVAINVDDARIPDNTGAQPIDQPVVAGGPDAYFTRLPIKVMHAALREAGHPVEISQTAGTYVCNHVFYGAMHALRRRRTRAGFVHVPPVSADASTGLSVDRYVEALRLALRVALITPNDAALAGGAEH